MRRISHALAIAFILDLIPYSSAGAVVIDFSPKGGCESAISDLITKTKTQLDIAVYSINNTAILKSLDEAKARGVKIRILTDHTEARANAAVTVALAKKGYDLRLNSSGKIMHNKFAVFDQKKVVTGSFNWTNPAEKVNEENCLILDEADAVAKYESRFVDHLWVVNTPEKSERYLRKVEARLEQKRKRR